MILRSQTEKASDHTPLQKPMNIIDAIFKPSIDTKLDMSQNQTIHIDKLEQHNHITINVPDAETAAQLAAALAPHQPEPTPAPCPDSNLSEK